MIAATLPRRSASSSKTMGIPGRLTLTHEVGRAIGTTTRDHDDLDDLGVLRALRAQGIDQLSNVPLFVIGRNCDADLRRNLEIS